MKKVPCDEGAPVGPARRRLLYAAAVSNRNGAYFAQPIPALVQVMGNGEVMSYRGVAREPSPGPPCQLRIRSRPRQRRRHVIDRHSVLRARIATGESRHTGQSGRAEPDDAAISRCPRHGTALKHPQLPLAGRADVGPRFCTSTMYREPAGLDWPDVTGGNEGPPARHRAFDHAAPRSRGSGTRMPCPRDPRRRTRG